MKIIDQYHVIEHITPNILQQIERYARNCYKSEDKITKDSAEKMVKMLIKKNHGAILEFGDIVVRLVTSRSVLAELTRHRMASFAVESQRYVSYKDGIEFITPVWWDKSSDYQKMNWEQAMEMAENYYLNLLNSGWRAEEAREVLPNSTKTEIILKANIREFRHIFKLRTSKKAHPQIRNLFTNLLIDLKKQIQVVFDDIGGEND